MVISPYRLRGVSPRPLDENISLRSILSSIKKAALRFFVKRSAAKINYCNSFFCLGCSVSLIYCFHSQIDFINLTSKKRERERKGLKGVHWKNTNEPHSIIATQPPHCQGSGGDYFRSKERSENNLHPIPAGFLDSAIFYSNSFCYIAYF